MIAIVNTDPNWGIGKASALQVHISGDLKRFKEMTTGKVIVYGSKTMQTFPKGKPLPNRINIIMTRNPRLNAEGAFLCSTLDNLFKKIEELKIEHGFTADDFIVVGGATIYEMLLPYCNKCYVTRIDKELPADCYFPNLDLDDEWELQEKTEWFQDQKNKLKYQYLTYLRK